MKYAELIIISFIIGIISLSIQSCNKDTSSQTAAPEIPATGTTTVKDTWSIIQDNILTPSCECEFK